MDDLHAMEAQGLFWESYLYGEYLNAADDQLENLIGRTSVQSELGFIADMQEARELPLETAIEIVKGNYSPFLES